MNLVKILGLSKSERHNYYQLEKKQEFFAGFRKLLVDFGFDEDRDPAIYGFGRPSDENYEYITTKEEDIKAYVDVHYYFENDEFRIDVVFGSSKIFLIINSDKDKQKEVSKKVQKFCSF